VLIPTHIREEFISKFLKYFINTALEKIRTSIGVYPTGPCALALAFRSQRDHGKTQFLVKAGNG
jgi:hypothetical protein